MRPRLLQIVKPRADKLLQQGGRVQSYIQKAPAFLHTNDKHTENEIRTTKNNKNKTPEKDLCNENFEEVKKKTEEDDRKWKDILCSR